jgi:hypothetical protein
MMAKELLASAGSEIWKQIWNMILGLQFDGLIAWSFIRGCVSLSVPTNYQL